MRHLAATILMLPLLLASCIQEPHTYRIPEGQGEVRYSPGRGIYREGSELDEQAEYLFRRGQVAFESGDWKQALNIFGQLRSSSTTVDGPRGLDAFVMESIVELERARGEQQPWRLHELANVYLDREVNLASVRRIPEEFLTEGALVKLRSLAATLSNRGGIERSFQLSSQIFQYYSVGLGASYTRLIEVTQNMRNLVWYAYLAEEYRLGAQIAADLVGKNPRSDIRSSAQILQAQCQMKLGLFTDAEAVYRQVFTATRDPDVREEALLGEVEAILRSSKGWQYDREPYLVALQKINDYKTSFLTFYSDARRKREFARIERSINDIIYEQETEAATAYARLFKEKGEEHYLERAKRWLEVSSEQEELLAGTRNQPKPEAEAEKK